MIQRLFLALLLGLSLLAGPALAVAPDEVLDDPVLESRARALSSELRCMVCQNQSIDDSDAPLAKDLRILVRERLVAGDSDEQVVDYLVSRYGEFVLLKPRFAWHTIVLWAAGPVALIAGLIAIGAALRKRARNRSASTDTSASTLTADEERRLQALLDKTD
ncbi:cytochrome C biogenesis protein [Stappia aggregata IAM 12614]|uniref:Cytochrome c-type biogenesis protein n=1 Tax=Roseibium aggregatum (strain ATCC 25650 / DSM 13394 / JCM 20685 / NBRC 16684 / NCIMB 2208 / IAM 12614 / B1) TaxID=384765 RepID=A0NLQ7_ROSAI|nr:cytochrome c-type biogenesis protein [Roseibium aggregatum]EAV46002.1 cytochrome C biogenesis protein [Stappia aggregata IAM 12614] [Roseibium aggregatum IAM 12614]